jgi:hypothetical protein
VNVRKILEDLEFVLRECRISRVDVVEMWDTTDITRDMNTATKLVPGAAAFSQRTVQFVG